MPTPLTGRFWGDLRSLAVPVATWWLTTVVAFALFSAVILVTEGPKPENFVILGIFGGATALGGVFGQACGLLRLRTWVVVVLGMMGSGALFALTAAMVSLGEVAVLMGLVAFLFPFFAVTGWWSLTPNGAMLSTFTPLVYIIGTVITVASATGSDARWLAGEKWAIWDIFTLPVLVLGVVGVLAFLASRESHRLHHWQNLGAPTLVTTERKAGSRLGGWLRGAGTLVVLGMLGLALTVGSAVLAPYLWRTGPAEEGDGNAPPQPRQGEQRGTEGEPQEGREGEPEPERRKSRGGAGGGESPERQPGSPMTPEEMQESARKAGVSVLFLLLFALLALLAIAVFGPPLRRTLLLTHMRRPLWPVPPTRHVQQSWWLVEVALADLDVPHHPGDSAGTFAHRAVGHLPPALLVDPILEVAAVADRVAYGLGLQPDDTMRARRQAEMAYEAVWSQLTEGQKIRAMYRWV